MNEHQSTEALSLNHQSRACLKFSPPAWLQAPRTTTRVEYQLFARGCTTRLRRKLIATSS
jgi:hypothetical protein